MIGFQDRIEGDCYPEGLTFGRIKQWRTEKTLEYYFCLRFHFGHSKVKPSMQSDQLALSKKVYVLHIAIRTLWFARQVESYRPRMHSGVFWSEI